MSIEVGPATVKIIPGNYEIDVAMSFSHGDDDHASVVLSEMKRVLSETTRQTYLHKKGPGHFHHCLGTFGFFIPKEAREPFWNHLLEDRDTMLARGIRPWVVDLGMVSQIAWMLVLGLKDVVIQLVARTLKQQ